AARGSHRHLPPGRRRTVLRRRGERHPRREPAETQAGAERDSLLALRLGGGRGIWPPCRRTPAPGAAHAADRHPDRSDCSEPPQLRRGERGQRPGRRAGSEGRELVYLMRFLLTGASGQLGAWLASAADIRWPGPSRGGVDLTDAGAVRTALVAARPDIVL